MQNALPFLSFMSGQLALDNAPVFSDDGSEAWMRYGALRDKINNLKQTWQSAPARGLVLCALPRTIDGAIAYLSAAESGHCLLLVDPDAFRLDLFIEAYSPDWALLPTTMHPGGNYSLTDWPLENIILWRHASPQEPSPHADLFALLLPPGPPESVKTVRLSYKNIASNLHASLEVLPFSSQSCSLIHMPLAYSFGLSILHMVLATGGRGMLTEKPIKDRALWTLMQQRGVNMFPGVPFHYEHIARAGLDLLHVPALKCFLQAGGKIPLERRHELLRQISERQGQFYILYGQTEAAPRMAYLALHERPEKIGSYGTALKGGTLWAEDGDIFYQGPNVMMGYATKRSDCALDPLPNPILRTGDKGFLDEEGFLFLE